MGGKARRGLGVVSEVGEDEGALGAPTSLWERQEALMKAVMLQRGPFDLRSRVSRATAKSNRGRGGESDASSV